MLNKILKLFNRKIVELDSYITIINSFSTSEEKLKNINVDGKDCLHKLPEHKEPLSNVIHDHELDTSLINKEVKKIKHHSLTIYFLSGMLTTWEIDKDLDDKYFPWRDFYTWYLSRGTELFVFKCQTGDAILKRDQINHVERKFEIRESNKNN